MGVAGRRVGHVSTLDTHRAKGAEEQALWRFGCNVLIQDTSEEMAGRFIPKPPSEDLLVGRETPGYSLHSRFQVALAEQTERGRVMPLLGPLP